jgi:hypothetical protein
MKNGKEFDNILDECLERILTGGETVEQCLERHPQWAGELAPLLRTSLLASKAAAVEPRSEFRDRARYQMRAALQEMAEKRERRFSLFRWQPRWATAVIAVLVLVMASGGTVAAADNSMPDEILYPVKLATESVRLTLTPSALGKAELYLELADKRVAEIVAMANKGNAGQVELVARRLNTYLAQAADLVASETGAVGLVTAPPPVPEQALPEKAPVLLAPAPAAVPEEAPTAGGPPAIVPSMRAVPEKGPPEKEAAAEEVSPVTPGKPEAPAPGLMMVPAPPASQAAGETPEDEDEDRDEEDKDEDKEEDKDEPDELDQRIKLRMIMIRNALEHSEALRAALDRVPEEARPALLRAIAESDTAYQRLLEILEEAGK